MSADVVAKAGTFDCRKAFAETLTELARTDRRIVAVCNDSVGSSNLTDFAALMAAFWPSTSGAPVAVVANTVKGKGVSFIEDRVEWHHKVPTAEQVTQALEELT